MATICIPVVFVAIGPASVGADSAFVDKSPHHMRMVTVDGSVRLETLDWGGSGPALVLLAGLGGTAHVYDELAPKLCDRFHVYGITRRGFGKSSVPSEGYGTDQLADDDVSVLDALKLKSAIFVGHSIAGLELSSLAARHPARVAGLVYLDPTYLSDKSDQDLFGVAEWHQHVQALREQLDILEASTDNPIPSAQNLLASVLPAVQKDMQLLTIAENARPPFHPPGPKELSNFSDFGQWFEQVQAVRVKVVAA